ncbi:mechanosensitive ion channel domain-containing protein [Haloglomus salinum]|jgi:small-conductance mechanosensitive channel|uniref:mechanosensitive ion channel domain-containing protein n=1 Tax=Haloglomus salinum TaxID=2962673 RepID=UPI0020C9B0E1|nr:mechanosensitive ion channel domain-containing protein [Haloglomus salinum]
MVGQIAALRRLLRRLLTSELELFVASLIVVTALLLGLAVTRLLNSLLTDAGVPEEVEGTLFDRTARRLGTSTVNLVSRLSGLFIVAVGTVFALRVAGVVNAGLLIERLADFLPSLFVAALVVILGLVLGDKAELVVGERLRSVKLPEVNALPLVVKYSIFYVAALVALGQLGVATAALLVLLAAYAFGVFFIGGLAFKDMLSSAAAGFYLVLNEPYTIGDEVVIDGQRGIVQEVDVFVTRIESDGREFILPNRQVFKNGIVRVRD